MSSIAHRPYIPVDVLSGGDLSKLFMGYPLYNPDEWWHIPAMRLRKARRDIELPRCASYDYETMKRYFDKHSILEGSDRAKECWMFYPYNVNRKGMLRNPPPYDLGFAEKDRVKRMLEEYGGSLLFQSRPLRDARQGPPQICKIPMDHNDGDVEQHRSPSPQSEPGSQDDIILQDIKESEILLDRALEAEKLRHQELRRKYSNAFDENAREIPTAKRSCAIEDILDRQIDEAQIVLRDTKNEKILLEQKNEQLLRQLDQAKQDYDTKVQELQQKNEQLNKAHQEHQAELQSLREKEQMLSSEKQQAQGKIQSLQKDLASARHEHLATIRKALKARKPTGGLDEQDL